jgi:ABC-2 type transport system ATP-binding protein
MSDLVIETTGLRKEFRRLGGRTRVAVDGLDLAVPRGGVHGFLGPNGSGKTTTIRMLLGLARATSGDMRLLGTEVPRRLPEVMDRIGAIVEEPKFLPSFSGRRNLTLLARSIGVGNGRVDDVLAEVGLEGRDRDRYKAYSLGMRQRLAIAAALLKSPEVLILDEPTNGLDPAGIRDIRQLVRDLGASGVTILLSSHILAEVQQVCDSATIIGNGRVLSSGKVTDLVGREHTSGARIRVSDPDRARHVLEGAGMSVTPERHRLHVDGATDTADITRLLAEQGLFVSELVPDRPDLESVFLRLTSDEGLPSRADSRADRGGSGSAGGAP